MWVYFRVFLVVVLLRSNPSADEMVADGMRQRQVVVTGGGDVAILDYRVMYVPTERLLDVGDVFDDGNAAHTNLLAPVMIRLHLSSHLDQCKSLDRVVEPTAIQRQYLQTTLQGARDLDRPRFRLQQKPSCTSACSSCSCMGRCQVKISMVSRGCKSLALAYVTCSKTLLCSLYVRCRVCEYYILRIIYFLVKTLSLTCYQNQNVNV